MFSARPPAKVNLTLEIVGRRPDGFHELRSVFLRVGGLSDRLSVSLGAANGTDTLRVDGLPGASASDNLVLRALELVRVNAGLALPALDLTLDKRIPVAAGMGGGSSDAAAALALARAAWGVSISRPTELKLAAALGSDVPFFVTESAAALVTGRGEEMSALPAIVGGAGLLLVTPAMSISTGSVFGRFDALTGAVEPGTATDELARELRSGIDGTRLAALAERLRDANHLWSASASLAPSLPALRERLEQATDRPWLLSGSGPTLFAIYPSAHEAGDAGRLIVARTDAADLLIHAADLTGPDPAWRYP